MNFKKYHVSKNLFDYSNYFDSTFVAYGQYFEYATITLSPNTTYTASTSYKKNGNEMSFMIVNSSTTPTTASYGLSNETPITITTNDDGIVRLYKRTQSASQTKIPTKNDFVNLQEWLMLNTGSSTLPYEPYSSEVWHDTPHYIHNTSTDTLTTLPADIYSNDTTATVGLKGQMVQSSTPSPTTPITPSECGERTGNLFDESTISSGYYAITTGIRENSNYYCSDFIPITAATYYFQNVVGSSVQNSVVVYDVNKQGLRYEKIIGREKVSGTLTFIEGDAYIRINCYSTTDVDTVMVSLGSTALPYEPYGYKLDISSGGNNLFDLSTIINGVIDQDGNIVATGSSYRTSDYIPVSGSNYIISLIMNIDTARRIFVALYDGNKTFISRLQSSEMTNTGLKTYTFSANTANFIRICIVNTDTNIMLNEGSTALPYEPYNRTTTPIYLGEVQSTRRIKKLVLTGEEQVLIHQTIVSWFQIFLTDIVINNLELCTHYKPSPYNPANIQNGEIIVGKQTAADEGRIVIRDTAYTTADDLKSYLAQQYAAGTPVTVWYVLETETTGIVNEPLRKIGDYVDTVSGITIPTITGKDTFDVLTTLKPSEVSLAYTGWHDASVKEWDGSEWQ